MASEQRYWVQKNKQLSILILSVIGVVISFTLLTIAAYKFNWNWTGINDYTLPTPQYQRGKTLWDWIVLFVVPLVLALIAFWINQTQSNINQRAMEQRAANDEKAARLRAEIDRGIALDNQQDGALTAYIDRISELLLKEGLHKPAANIEVRYIARARTLTVLHRLDRDRRGSVIQFLYEADLITNGTGSIVNLKGANLINANLHEVNLSRANLSKTRLSNADLIGANLSEALLQKADLGQANLFKADLSGADLSEAMLDNATLNESDLTGANLSGATLKEAQLNNVKLSNAILTNATLFEADLTSANLSGANLHRADLSFVNLNGADLTGANLSGADLRDANLTGVIGANFSDAILH